MQPLNYQDKYSFIVNFIVIVGGSGLRAGNHSLLMSGVMSETSSEDLALGALEFATG